MHFLQAGEKLQVGARLKIRIGPGQELNAAVLQHVLHVGVDAVAERHAVIMVLGGGDNDVGLGNVPRVQVHRALAGDGHELLPLHGGRLDRGQAVGRLPFPERNEAPEQGLPHLGAVVAGHGEGNDVRAAVAGAERRLQPGQRFLGGRLLAVDQAAEIFDRLEPAARRHAPAPAAPRQERRSLLPAQDVETAVDEGGRLALVGGNLVDRAGQGDLEAGESPLFVQLQEFAVIGGQVQGAAVGRVDDGIEVAPGIDLAAAEGRHLDDLEAGFAEIDELVLLADQEYGLAVRGNRRRQQAAGDLLVQQGAIIEQEQVFLLVAGADQDLAPARGGRRAMSRSV